MATVLITTTVALGLVTAIHKETAKGNKGNEDKVESDDEDSFGEEYRQFWSEMERFKEEYITEEVSLETIEDNKEVHIAKYDKEMTVPKRWEAESRAFTREKVDKFKTEKEKIKAIVDGSDTTDTGTATESDYTGGLDVQEAIEEQEEQKEEKEALQEKVEKPKMVIKTSKEARDIDITTPSNWTADDFELIVNKEIKPLIPVAIRMEEELGVNALYLMAVGINETGWGRKMSGRYNYFNWSNDGRRYFGFDSMQHFSDFSTQRYRESYTRPEYYTKKLGKTPDKITIEVVNVIYAVNHDGSTNWQWTKTVSDVMRLLSDRRLKELDK